ncbi:hypothetical protein ACFVTC_42160 [Streptomyces sp. NPDC057950]|uniref:hypothetical protein n=1 Tax=Streptomyces sp. NPDC057950 TaxID=3346288 RepID=UPI0036E214A2
MAYRMRRAVLCGAAFVLASAGLATGSGSASAGTAAVTVFHQKCELPIAGDYESVVYDQDNHYVGLAEFVANGDKMEAVDPRSDGYYVVAHLGTGGLGRTASTQGKGTYSGWATGDLPENHTYYMYVEMHEANGSASTSLPSCKVTS